MVLIDGHNLLWEILDIDAGAGSSGEIRLAAVLDRYFGLTGQSGEIIFDGAGPLDKGEFDALGNVTVVFAGPGGDADSLIEGKIAHCTAPQGLTVVSSDRRLGRAAGAKKVKVVKADGFWKQVRQQLEQKRPPEEPPAKQDGVSSGETERWLEYFGLDK